MMNFILMLIAMVLVFILSVPVLIANTTRKLYRRESIREYFKVVAFGFDQVGGSIIYSQEDWKVSSWTYHLAMLGNIYAYWFMKFINWLFMDEKHCEESFWKEAEQLKFIPEWMDG